MAFQTNSLNCTLATYRITADGYFEQLRPPHEPPAAASQPVWIRLPETHSYLPFYTSGRDLPASFVAGWPPGEWFEFRAKFTDGRLVSIVRIAAESGELLLPGLPGIEQDC